ncbi:MAG: SHOCT domain-containing protein [Actinobacteria bacterium]|nr:SHOCT domain-containing protein [Actinomycetota bacterium]
MMFFLWLPLLLLCPLAMFLMMRSGTGMGTHDRSHAGHAPVPLANGADPIEIARQRLARGEIDSTQFEEIRRAIS